MDNNTIRAAFFHKAQDGFLIFDKDLNLIDANEGFFNTLHLPREEVIGKHASEFAPEVLPSKQYKLYRNVLRTGKPAVIENVAPQPGPGMYSFRVYAFKVGEGLGVVSTNKTDLREAIDDLETFIYKSSHNLRSPISSILGLVNLALSEMKEDDKAVQYFNLIKKETEQLNTILNRLIETAWVKREQKVIRSIDFNELLDEILQDLRAMKGFQDIRFYFSVSLKRKYYSDKRLLKLILFNLLDNAIKYKKPKAENSFVNIEVRDDPKGVIIKISENGIGIKTQFVTKVFDMFFRANDRVSGAGLGLYTVKHTVKRLGGDISMKSKEYDGTSFTISVPNEHFREDIHLDAEITEPRLRVSI